MKCHLDLSEGGVSGGLSVSVPLRPSGMLFATLGFLAAVWLLGVGWLAFLFSRLRRSLLDLEGALRQRDEANDDLGQNLVRLEEAARMSRVLNETLEWLQACNMVSEAGAVIAFQAAKAFPDTSGCLRLKTDSGMLKTVSRWGVAKDDGQDETRPEDCWALRLGRAAVQGGEGGSSCRSCQSADGGVSVCVPLSAMGEDLGALRIDGAAARFDSAAAAGFGERVSLALASIRMRETIKLQASTDHLTGLLNRRSMEERLGQELRRARRKGLPVSFAMVDLDRFKDVNDNYGHESGDAVLRRMGELLRSRMRQEDVVCRFGGEELGIIFPEATAVLAAERCEDLRKRIASEVFTGPKGERFSVTASFGVAQTDLSVNSEESLVLEADKALYEAKRAGRNNVAVAPCTGVAAVSGQQDGPLDS